MRRDLGRLHRAPGSGDPAGRTEVIERGAQTADSTAAARCRKLYLIGFMGAGKTEVGSRLALALGARFEDLDRAIEAAAGVSISRVFEETGEEEFRRLETAALRRLALTRDDCVIATGGGTPTLPENVDLMRSTGITFWLDPPFEEILARLDRSARDRRPLFSSENEARALYQARRAAYAAAGTRVKIAAREGPGEIIERIRRDLAESAWTADSKVSSR